jgi:hypothetical protein
LVGAIGLILFTAIVIIVFRLTPGEDEKPLITIYMEADCEACGNWADYLRTHGFRIRRGDERELSALRAQFRLAPGFRGRHMAIVDGLFVEGHVPAGDIQEVLRAPHHANIRGLVVPGTPKGAPGISSVSNEQFAVYAVYGAGLMRPLTIHNHFM